MTRARTLEDRYRRLLALYPAEHRAVHGEEMLGVLMTAAAPGQRYPARAESAALVLGAIRIRLRPGRAAPSRYWQDALAAVSVVLPLLMIPYWPVGNVPLLFSLPPGAPSRFALTHLLTFFAVEGVRTSGPWIILAVLTLLRLRRTAGVVAVAALIVSMATTVTTPNSEIVAPFPMLSMVALGLEAAALLASPGPRRGWQMLGWAYGALALLLAASLGLASFWLWQARPVLADLIVIVTIAGALSGLAAVSPAGRRSALLLLLPAYYVVLSLFLQPPVISLALQTSWAEPLRITLEWAPLGVLALAGAVRYARPLNPVDPQPPAIG